MTFAGIVAYIIGILNQLVFVLVALAVLVFLWGWVDYIRKTAMGKRPDKKKMLWSLVTLFVLISVWGILRLACNTFISANLCGSQSFSGNPYNNYEVYDPRSGDFVGGI